MASSFLQLGQPGPNTLMVSMSLLCLLTFTARAFASAPTDHRNFCAYLVATHAHQVARPLNDPQQSRVLQGVENIFPLAPGGQQVDVPQAHQLLRNICLTLAQQTLQVANAGLPFTQGEQQAHPKRVPKRLEQAADLLTPFAC